MEFVEFNFTLNFVKYTLYFRWYQIVVKMMEKIRWGWKFRRWNVLVSHVGENCWKELIFMLGRENNMFETYRQEIII